VAITEPRDILRLKIGDRDATDPLFGNDELDVFLAESNGNVLYAAAEACESLARRFARDFDFKWKDQSFSRSQMAKAYRDQAKDLRAQAAAGGGAPWSGGTSQARKGELAGKADRVQPTFSRDQFTNN
jgi:hypothetical protein